MVINYCIKHELYFVPFQQIVRASADENAVTAKQIEKVYYQCVVHLILNSY